MPISGSVDSSGRDAIDLTKDSPDSPTLSQRSAVLETAAESEALAVQDDRLERIALLLEDVIENQEALIRFLADLLDASRASS